MEFESELITIDDDIDTTCSVCFAEFLDPDDLKMHVSQMHVEENLSRKCQFCPTSLNDALDYVVHIRDVHLTSIKSCKYCTRVFTDFEEFRRHENKHKCKTNQFSCSICSTLFNNIAELELHEREHGDKGEGVVLHEYYPLLSSVLNIKASTLLQQLGHNSEYVCLVCAFSNHDLDQYIKHLQENKCQSYVCHNCSNVYSRKRGLLLHFRKHKLCHHYMRDVYLTRQCQKCDKYLDVATFNVHIKYCKIIKCSQCDIKFGTIDELSQHQASEHPLAVTLVLCKYCCKEFVGNVALEKHMNRIHGKDHHLYKYFCVYCDMYYKHPKKLLGHFFSRHKDLQPYTCNICDRKFRVRKRFTLHIKLDHKSVGFVEFDDKFHVIFTDKKTEKSPQTASVLETDHSETENAAKTQNMDKTSEDKCDSNPGTVIDKSEKITKTNQENPKNEDAEMINRDFINASETEGNQTEADTHEKSLPIRAKRKLDSNGGNTTKVRKLDVTSDTEFEILNSDDTDEDEPLINVKAKVRNARLCKRRNAAGNREKRRFVIKNNKKKLTCKICKKYCYTYQNYHHHMSLHYKNEDKKCIKCFKVFKSKGELKQHVTSVHSSSKLTETLKTLLAKRKGADVTKPISNAERFQRTIKKVDIDNSNVRATLSLVPKDGLSVQKFIENFTPETSETTKKKVTIDLDVTLKLVSNYVQKPPIIKMTKFKPETEVKTNNKLSMPVKFKQNINEQHKISVTLVQKPVGKAKMNFNVKEIEANDDDTDVLQEEYLVDDEINQEQVKNDLIPEVAHEVMLEGTEEMPKTKQVQHKIIIPELPTEYNKVHIAHLLPEAPYYKIVKMKDILKENTEKKEVDEVVEDVTLPDGTKLVNVNPLAHLLGDKIGTVLPVNKNKSYQPKTVDYVRVITKALMKLDKTDVKKPASIKSKTASEQ